MIMTATNLATYGQRGPRPGTGRRRRMLQYRLTVGSVVAVSIAISVATAKLWPIQGLRIQASFFLSLASSCLTLFGLVFTLCLIGTQFMVARTNVVVRRIFGPGTWLYLVLFVITILWTLAISYRADNSHSSARLCAHTLSVRHCISEAQAGRASIFGVTWSLLLLLPFILYIYRRLTVAYAFSSIVNSILRARTVRTFRRRCERLSAEILALSSETTAIEQGIAYLLELGILAVKRRRIIWKKSAYSDALDVTKQFYSLNQALASYPELSSLVLDSLKQWSVWLIVRAEQLSDKDLAPDVITYSQVREITRMAVDAATYSLHEWQSSPGTMSPALASVHLLQEVAEACKDRRVRMNFSLAARELANCAARKAIEKSEMEFNLAIRGLISVTDIAVTAVKVNLRGEVTVQELSKLLTNLGIAANGRMTIPSWVLNELHDLTTTISGRYNPTLRPFKRYLASLASLQPMEIITILRGSFGGKQQNVQRIGRPWQALVLESLRASASEDVALAAQSAVVASWIKDNQLNEVISIFERLGSDYINGDGRYTSVLLGSVLDDFRLGFQQNPVIKEELWRRRLASQRRRRTKRVRQA